MKSKQEIIDKLDHLKRFRIKVSGDIVHLKTSSPNDSFDVATRLVEVENTERVIFTEIKLLEWILEGEILGGEVLSNVYEK